MEFSDSGRSFAVALILRAEGSTPGKVGGKAVIDESGKIFGTIGGGQVEAEAQRRAVEACKSKRPAVFDFFLEGACAEDVEPICGGAMRILIDPTAAKDRAAYAQAAEALERRKRGVLITTIRTAQFVVPPLGGRPTEVGTTNARPTEVGTTNARPTEVGTTNTDVMVQWFPEEGVAAEAGFPGADAIRSCLGSETPQLFVTQIPTQSSSEKEESSVDFQNLKSKIQDHEVGLEVIVEPVIPKPLLLIVGGGHIGQALAIQATLIGFAVTVIDDRPEFTAPSLFPEGVTTRCGDIAKEVADFPIAADTYVVIVTRGHQHDAEALRACIHAPAAYIGMIGSKRKVALMRKDFIESGLATEEEWNRVFTPIGLDIGAMTVPEIATSIAAQLIVVRRKGGNVARAFCP